MLSIEWPWSPLRTQKWGEMRFQSESPSEAILLISGQAKIGQLSGFAVSFHELFQSQELIFLGHIKQGWKSIIWVKN